MTSSQSRSWSLRDRIHSALSGFSFIFIVPLALVWSAFDELDEMYVRAQPFLGVLNEVAQNANECRSSEFSEEIREADGKCSGVLPRYDRVASLRGYLGDLPLFRRSRRIWVETGAICRMLTEMRDEGFSVCRDTRARLQSSIGRLEPALAHYRKVRMLLQALLWGWLVTQIGAVVAFVYYVRRYLRFFREANAPSGGDAGPV